ncbi:MAG: sigma factor-like helix-turn-helix DNA-binding protein [Patescibacteria group bacterium]|nr:hypothetical protein [Patescibacteria group bacterium]MBU1877048.1 hypothetical protein [Patescibacteria group bacterium]
MSINYQKICAGLLKDFSQRTKDVIVRRFGLEVGTKETLESIGADYGVTRERIRQIESDGIVDIKARIKKEKDSSVYQAFGYIKEYLTNSGGLKKEEILLDQSSEGKFTHQIAFLLNLSDDFKRFSETENTYSFWTISSDSWASAKNAIESAYKMFTNKKQSLSLKECSDILNIKPEILLSYIEISKKISQGSDGRFGLEDWPEINPRVMKDKAFLVFQKQNRPLHFSQVAELIGTNALVQTVHNELIRDQRFVLVGRGIYALADWGYKPGTVKEVISDILAQSSNPLSKDEILKKVSEQRIVKTNTVLLNLSNKQRFLRNSQGKYLLRDA